MRAFTTHTALVSALSLLAALPSQAAVVYTAISPTASLPITQLGSVGVQPFDLAAQSAVANYSTVSTLPGLPSGVAGTVSLATPLNKYTMPTTWPGAWANGYTGAVFSQTAESFTLPPRVTAFYLFVSPNSPSTAAAPNTVYVRANSTLGNMTETNPAVPVPTTNATATPDAVPGFGFHTDAQDEYLQEVLVSSTGGNNAMYTALFGIAQVANAPNPTAATLGNGGQVSFTAPTEPGTHPATQFELLCQLASSGPTGSSGTASPLALLAGAAVGDTCRVRMLSAAGAGLWSAPITVTAAPPVVTTVTPVPTLSSWAMLALGFLTAGLALRRRQ